MLDFILGRADVGVNDGYLVGMLDCLFVGNSVVGRQVDLLGLVLGIADDGLIVGN